MCLYSHRDFKVNNYGPYMESFSYFRLNHALMTTNLSGLRQLKVYLLIFVCLFIFLAALVFFFLLLGFLLVVVSEGCSWLR